MEKEKGLELISMKTDKKGMKENIKMTKRMALVFFIFKMEFDMKDSLKMVIDMGGQNHFLQVMAVMKDSTKSGREMEWEFKNGIMGTGWKENIKIINLMGKHLFAEQMGEQRNEYIEMEKG